MLLILRKLDTVAVINAARLSTRRSQGAELGSGTGLAMHHRGNLNCIWIKIWLMYILPRPCQCFVLAPYSTSQIHFASKRASGFRQHHSHHTTPESVHECFNLLGRGLLPPVPQLPQHAPTDIKCLCMWRSHQPSVLFPRLQDVLKIENICNKKWDHRTILVKEWRV